MHSRCDRDEAIENGIVEMTARGKRVPDISPRKRPGVRYCGRSTSASNSHIDVEALPRLRGHYAQGILVMSSCTVRWGG